jgi:molybdopterin converting factor small subunit
MKLQVQYTAQLRAALGRSEDRVLLPEGSSLAELLVHLSTCHGQAREHLLTDGGETRPSLLMVVNGVAVTARDARSTVLHSEDVVILMPPIAGG